MVKPYNDNNLVRSIWETLIRTYIHFALLTALLESILEPNWYEYTTIRLKASRMYVFAPLRIICIFEYHIGTIAYSGTLLSHWI